MLIQPEPGLAIWTIVVFLALAILLGKFAWKPLLAVLAERERTIREALDQARLAREESEGVLEKNRAILADAQNQASEFLDRARREAEARRAEVADRARHDAEILLARSREEIERQKRAAIREIRAQTADLAVQAASVVVGRNLDGEAQRRLVEDYLASLPEGG